MKTLIDPDKLNSVTARKVANAAMGILDSVQLLTKEEIIAGAATFQLLLCQRYGIEAGEALRIGARIMHDKEKRRPEFNAIVAFMEHEMK